VTQIDFTSYQPPGLYVEETSTPLVSIVGASGPTIVAIVGPSIGYRTHTEAVVLSGTTAVLLSNLGIDTTSVVVKAPDGTTFDLATYSLTVGGGADANMSTAPDNTLTIARSGSGIPDDSTVFVTYNYTDPTYFDPTLFGNYEDVKDAYGQPFDLTSGAILSPLSLAAQFAFANGAREVFLVASAGSATAVSRAQLATALARLEAVDVDIVVTLPVGITGTPGSPGDVVTVVGDLATHCDNASNDHLYRVGITGSETTSTVVPSTVSGTVRDKRVMYAWPNQMSFFNGLTNTTIVIGGYYLAAAYAGMFASLDDREGITRKQVRGFSGIPIVMANTMSSTLKNSYSSAGVAVTERRRDGSLTVRHGTSTDPTSIQTREMSLTRARDSLVTLAYQTFDSSGMIGTPIDLDTPARIKGLMTGVLEAAKTSRLIVGYNGVLVRQRSLDPTVIEIKFQYLPAFPLNYVVMSFAIDLNTGETDIFAQTA
jgi:hypothetical protein